MSGIPAGAGSLINKRLGKYEILALLALGGTAEIYLARIGGTNGFEKYVVVKCLHDHLADDPDFVKMFLDEARISAVLDHSNIVQTYELGEYENRYYMVMEFLAGLSLAMVVRRAGERIPGGVLPVPLTLNIAAQACAGLHYAHERQQSGKPLNLVHRDISPQNLVISFEGVVKVVDFGIARAEYRETKTKAGTIKGKFAYMSPEQCVANNVDRRTDVFALGVIIHELLTGRRLFKRASPYETYQAVLECAVDPPSKVNNQLDPALDAIVMKAVAKDKEHRYATAEAFGDAMLGYLHHRGKSSGGNELGRYFEQFFGQEIEEHGERMRELIEGRDQISIEMGGSWDEEDDKKRNETVDLGKKEEEVGLQTGEIINMRPSEASLDRFVGRLETEMDGGAGVSGDDDDDDGDDGGGGGGGQNTRIEMNPLELMAQLDQQVARNSSPSTPVPPGTQTGTGAAPLPAPPTGPNKTIPAPPKGANKFLPPQNMPTVVAADAEQVDVDGETVLKPSLDLAPTAMAAPIVSEAAFKPTAMAMDAQKPPVDVAGPMSSTQYSVRASAMQASQQGTQPEMAAQSDPSRPSMSDYPVMPGGQRPFSSDLAPSNLSSGPQRSPYGDQAFDASSPANLMSPVGQSYPQTDWERAAAQSAKALPPWMLAAIFVGALGGALLLTIVLAKIFS
jgi:serine/threonine protein kinase